MKLIAVYDDPFWASETIEHIRFTARVFLKNSQGQYGFLKIVGEDLFGQRSHLETVGGGVEEGESFFEAAQREVLEEMGCTASNYQLIGAIIDRLNPLKRLTCSVFYVADSNEDYGQLNRTEEEKILIEDTLWLTKEETIQQMSVANSSIDAFVHRRDLSAFLELFKDE